MGGPPPHHQPRQLEHDQMKIDDLTKDLKWNLYQACVQNTNPHPKPKSSDSKSDLIYKRVFVGCSWCMFFFCSIFSSSCLSSPLLSSPFKSPFMLRLHCFTRAGGTQSIRGGFLLHLRR